MEINDALQRQKGSSVLSIPTRKKGATRKSGKAATTRVRGSVTLARLTGQVLARLRVKRGQSQEQLAKQLNMTQSALSRIEQGQPLGIDQLWLFADAFGLEPPRLVQQIQRAQAALEAHGVRVVIEGKNDAPGLLGGLALGALLTVLVRALSDED